MLMSIISLVSGFVLLIWSADAFTNNGAKIANIYMISPLIIGLLIFGFGTSAPEMLVSGLAAYAGHPQLSIGNAFGSNIFNTVAVLAIPALISTSDIPLTSTSVISGIWPTYSAFFLDFGFMFAPNYHLTMKYVAPIRKKIGSRTIFNLLGPLSSPANVKRQVVGVFAKKWLLPFANALKNLQSKHAWIVHSEDGMDEISPFAITNIVELKNNKISEIKIDPKKIGVKFNNPDNLKGQDADYNANKIIDIFSGSKNEFSEAVCLNSAAALIVCNKFNKFEEAYEFSKKHLESDKALIHLKKIQTF